MCYLSHLLGLSLSLQKSKDITDSDGSLDVSDQRSLALTISLVERNSDLNDTTSRTGTSDDLLDAGQGYG